MVYNSKYLFFVYVILELCFLGDWMVVVGFGRVLLGWLDLVGFDCIYLSFVGFGLVLYLFTFY